MDAENGHLIKITVFAFKCLRCHHEWIPRVELSQLKGGLKEKPRICPHCKSAYWDIPKKNKKARK